MPGLDELSFRWPALLWAVLLLPLLALLYRAALRGPGRDTVVHSRLAEIASLVRTSGRRRHLAAACFGAALLLVVVALARPVAPVSVPAERATIMLALDVSRSMRAMDVSPSRFEAAKEAAREFVGTVPRGVRVGLVAFSGIPRLIVPPVGDRERVLDGIAGLWMGGGTAIGDGLLAALDALPRAGDRPSGVVVLLSDGQNRQGTDPLEAAARARADGVTVYTVGVGQRGGLPGGMPGGMFWFGGILDEETLRAIAQVTGGAYFHASSADGLRAVYRRLARLTAWERRPDEVTALAALGALAALAGALLVSQRLHPLDR